MSTPSAANRLWAACIFDAIIQNPSAAPLAEGHDQEVAVVQMLLREGCDAPKTSERSAIYVSRLSNEARVAFSAAAMGVADYTRHRSSLATTGPAREIHATNAAILAADDEDERKALLEGIMGAFGFAYGMAALKPQVGPPATIVPEHPGTNIPIGWQEDLKNGEVASAADFAARNPHLLPYVYSVVRESPVAPGRFVEAYVDATGLPKNVIVSRSTKVFGIGADYAEFLGELYPRRSSSRMAQ